MSNTRWRRRPVMPLLAIAIVAIVTSRAPRLLADDEFQQQATWSIPTAEAVESEFRQWLAEQDVAPDVAEQIDAVWAEESVATPLERVTRSLALLDPDVEAVVTYCSRSPDSVVLPHFTLFDSLPAPETAEAVDEGAADVLPPGESVPAGEAAEGDEPAEANAEAAAVAPDAATERDPYVLNNVRLYFSRWLAQHRYYDESLELVAGLEPEQVVDPAALLFLQSTGYHRRLDKPNCLPRLARLLENEAEIPRRYATLARLMEADLKPLETDSLDEIARLMDDIQRRLELQRAGTRVRQQQEDVIAKLDRKIEELEQQQQQAGGGSGSGSNRSSAPADDSGIMGGRGPGNVDPRSIGSRSGWGNLPPRERHEALQQISKELPAHYREVIEEYFRSIARDGGE